MFREVSRTSWALAPKMARSRRSSAVRARVALRGNLADQDVARADLGADADDAVLVEVGKHVLGEVRDLAGDLLGAELGVAGIDLVTGDVDGRQQVLGHQALGHDDTVLVVKAFHGMYATVRFWPSASSP